MPCVTVKQLFAIGWAGRWSYEIHVTEKGTRITAGIPQADFYLKPGEEVRMPSVICITGTGEEVYARFRSFLKKKNGQLYARAVSADSRIPL